MRHGDHHAADHSVDCGCDGLAWVTINIAPAAGTTVSIVGDANGTYRQNLMFHRDAFALVVVPMVKPPGAVDVARESYKGTSARVIPYYDGDE